MAVFLINICKFNGCGITFPSLGDLIQHIEDTHIDYDPQVIEQKEQSRPACLPLSYVLRFITDAARKEGPFLGTSGAELKRKLAIKHHSYSMSSSNRSNTPTDMGSEMDEDEMMVSESEDSNDSWTTEEFSSEFIMRYGSRHSGPAGNSTTNEKPFACPVPGCKKRYKNVNGIKYHSKNGHKKDGKVRKGYKCHCGKSYKTSQGLKNHSLLAHNGANNGDGHLGGHHQVLATSSPSAAGSLSPSSASNASGGSNSSGHHHNQHGQQQQHHGNNSNQSSSSSSQLSPNGSSASGGGGGVVVSVASNLTNNNTSHHPPQHHHNSSSSSSSSVSSTPALAAAKSNFGLISMKQSKTAAAHKIGDGIGNGKLLGVEAGVKQNLPSLVNLGILTPATSPKHQAPPTPQTPSNHGGMHPLQQQQQHHQQQQQQQMLLASGSSDGGDHLMPLTPISPNMSKNMQYAPTTNNNNHIIHCNNNTTTNNNAAAEHIITDDT